MTEERRAHPMSRRITESRGSEARAAQEEPTSPRTVTVPMDLLGVVGKALYGWGDDEPNEATGYTAVYEATKLAAAIHESGYRREAAAATPSLDRDAMARALVAVVMPVDQSDPEPMVDDYDYADRVIALYERFARLDEGSATPEQTR